jgi:prepilin-type processing-associated H-X9-DG protein/prepilin-type N-terminal cleavage/methylation domain-containing protein
MRRCCTSRARGFTLVELLVVIGIIALLISVLLPSLNRARQSAQRTQCSAKLHNIMVAASIHAVDHKGFYPLAGDLTGVVPETLNDPDVVKYTYISVFDTVSSGSNGAVATAPRQIAPITYALGSEMGFKSLLSVTSNASLQTEMFDTTPAGITQNFWCPSQSDLNTHIMLPGHCFLYTLNAGTGGNAGFSEPQSYIYNEAVLGVNDALGRLRGQANRIKQSSMTMFAADGVGDASNATRATEGDPSKPGLFTVYNTTTVAPVTLDQAFNGSSGNAASTPIPTINNADPKRHQGLINIAFCDGHVETRSLKVTPGSGRNPASYKDLDTVYLLAQ